MASLVEGLAGALGELAKQGNLIASKIDNLELTWTVSEMENISFEDPVYLLETSRKGFRIRKIGLAGLSTKADVTGLTKDQAWANRHTLEYS